jgi:hypothetical protein
VEGALTAGQMSDALGLAGEKEREWSVRGSCAIKGDGLEEGLDWCVSFLSISGILLTAIYRMFCDRLVNVIQKK